MKETHKRASSFRKKEREKEKWREKRALPVAATGS
jgi:hypothetical protein